MPPATLQARAACARAAVARLSNCLHLDFLTNCSARNVQDAPPFPIWLATFAPKAACMRGVKSERLEGDVFESV